jgi:hypothetical protein
VRSGHLWRPTLIMLEDGKALNIHDCSLSRSVARFGDFALLALAPYPPVLADATPSTFLAPAPYSLVLAEADPSAVLALAAFSLVLTDAAPSAFLAPAATTPVLADAAPSAVLALAATTSVLTDAAPSAVLALLAKSLVLTHAVPSTLLALAASSPMLTDAAPDHDTKTSRGGGTRGANAETTNLDPKTATDLFQYIPTGLEATPTPQRRLCCDAF